MGFLLKRYVFDMSAEGVISLLAGSALNQQAVVTCHPRPATQLAKGYASLFQKTRRKGLYFGFLYVLDFGKKGLFFRKCQQFRKKRVFFWSFSLEKGYFPVLQVSVFRKKGSFFPSVNISEWVNFFI